MAEPKTLDKEELVQRLLEVASLKRELSEAHAVLDKAEISRKRSMDGGQTWPEYSLAERVNIVCGALKMPDEDLSATLPILSAKPPCGWQAWGQLVNGWLDEHGEIANMRAADLWDRIVEMQTQYVGPDIERANATHNDEPPCSERG